MTLRQQQIGVFLGTVIVIFGLCAGAILWIAQRLTDEAALQTSLLLARQVEIALADSLRQRPIQQASRSSPWDFLGRLFPGKQAVRPFPRSRRTEVKGLMRAYVDRSASIRAMWVLNQEGKVLYASRSREEGEIVTDPAMRDHLRQGITTIVSRGEGKASYYDVLVPLQMPKGVQGLGGLRLWINPADLTELMRGIEKQLTLLFLLAGGVALCSAFLTTALYTRRFRLISDTLRRAEAGTYFARPRYRDQDEVGASLDLIDRLVMKQRSATGSMAPLQRVAVATRTLAHEVRTPLNALAVHLEILRSLRRVTATPEPPDAQQERSLAALESSIHQVDQLVRDFSDYTAPLTLERHPLDLGDLLAASIEAMTAHCTSRGIRLAMDFAPGPWPIRGDATRLRQAFDNLLRNALEAQPNGGEIRVTGHRIENWLTLCFSDSGPGIPQEQRATLFDFGHSTKPGGSGIGLPLSQLIVEAHGGTLKFEETDGSQSGATFRLTLPIEEAPP
jgi:signal transduction histidine kinase